MCTVKINEVEALAGIPKKNIRFYEEQGLLTPRRNADNGYRDYGDSEVETLRQIRLLRKLGVPIEEIRHILNGAHTVGDGMRRHLVSLEREQRNLEQSMILCRELETLDAPISALDTQGLLEKMDQMEKGGTSFQNRQRGDIRASYTAPIVVTAVVVTVMLTLCSVLIWAFLSSADAPPTWLLILLLVLCAAVATGTVLALYQRIREIQKGEMDDAKYY